MKRRIGLWALSGLAVACCWVIAGVVIPPTYNFGRWTVAAITAPASLIGRAIPLAYYWFILLNAAAYAVIGLAAELLWRLHRQSLSN